MRDAEYLVGFLRFLLHEAYLDAKRRKLVTGAERWVRCGEHRRGAQGPTPRLPERGANMVSVSENAVLLTLAVDRKLSAFDESVPAGRWHAGIPRIVDVLELEGKKVGIVGLGNIGEKTVVACGRSSHPVYYGIVRRSAAEEERLGARFAPFETRSNPDVVTLHYR